jgi:hypothetical protein
MVIVRIDDIQAYAWSDIQRKMIDDALARQIPPSLAVIPLGLRDDLNLYNYLRSVRCNVEYALHGWDNLELVPGRGEFAELSERDARDRLEKGIAVIERLAHAQVTTFVPPLNAVSDGARKAISKMGIPVISSQDDSKKYDYDATTFDFTIDEFVGADPVLHECEIEFAEDGLCVIMLHPQDFITDGILDHRKYAEYIRVLDVLKERSATFVRFSDLTEAKTTR